MRIILQGRFETYWYNKRSNKGGMIGDQMQMAFMNEGGLTDDGMDVDPVSGNDIPFHGRRSTR